MTWKNCLNHGRKCIINTLAISKFIYKASILTYPEEALINKVKSDIFNFIWNKTDRIKRNTLIGDVKSGGIGVITMADSGRHITTVVILTLYMYIFKKCTCTMSISLFLTLYMYIY